MTEIQEQYHAASSTIRRLMRPYAGYSAHSSAPILVCPDDISFAAWYAARQTLQLRGVFPIGYPYQFADARRRERQERYFCHECEGEADPIVACPFSSCSWVGPEDELSTHAEQPENGYSYNHETRT